MDRPDLRILIPALAATGALLAAVVIAFAALGVSVGFEDLPERAGHADTGETHVRSATARGGPRASRRGVRSIVSSRGAAGAEPVLTRARGDAGSAPAEAGGADVGSGDAGGGEDVGTGGSAPTPSAPDAPPDTSPPDIASPITPPAPAETAVEGGPVTGTVSSLDGTLGGLTGVDPPIDDLTAPVTEPVDEVLAGVAGG